MHFQFFLDRLRTELGELRATSLEYLYLCSYELRGLIWTPGLIDGFRRRRGYDPTPYLPVLFGRTVGGPEVSDRFRYDFNRTLSDLIIEEFYAAARRMCNREGLSLCAEAGGPGPPLHQVPVDALRAQGAVDIVRGEFWNQFDIFVVKETACAAHTYGKPIVDMEAFTSWRQWLDGPGDLKPVADRAFCEGANDWANRLIGEAGLPPGERRLKTNADSPLAFKPPWKDYPLPPSGLLGPVRLLPGRRVPVGP